MTRDDAYWQGLYDMAYNLSASVPKMCLALAIKDIKASPDEKKATSQSLRAASGRSLSMDFLTALQEGHPGALPAAIGCLWMPSQHRRRRQRLR